jgi:hypothetical protein
MSLQTHLKELERKHKALEEAIHDAAVRPSSSDIEMLELKRRKLQLKDDIARVKANLADKTLH